MKECDWTVAVIVFAIIIVVCIIIKKIFFNGKEDIKTKISKLMMEGLKYEKNKEYQTAIYFLKKIISLTQDPNTLKEVYCIIAGCYMNLKRYKESLSFCNKSLEIDVENNLLTLSIRIHCNEKLGHSKELLNDLTLLNSFKPSDENVEKIKELIQRVSGNEASMYCENNVLCYSNIRYNSFFDTLVGILPKDEDDEVVYLIKNKQYEKLDEIFLKNEQVILKSIESFKFEKCTKNYSHNFIHASLYYLKGDYKKAKDLLKDSTSEFEMLFMEYLNSITSDYKPNSPILENKNILCSNNPTIIFYLAKIYYFQRDYDNYLHQMGKLLDYHFAYADFLSFFDQKNDEIKFEDFAKEALEKFPGNSRISYLCATYYHDTNQEELANAVLHNMDDNDPIKYFILGLINLKNPEVAYKHFNLAVELDTTYHSAYMFLFDFENGSDVDKSREILLASLSVASCYHEVFVSIRNLLVIEGQEYIKKMKMSRN